MFDSQVEAYLKSIKVKREDDKRIAVLRFFITPITHALASEVSQVIADRLFRNNGSAYLPVQEMGTTEFTIPVEDQDVSYQRHPDYPGHHVTIAGVAIGHISAQKVIPDDPNFSLIFDASFEILDKTMIGDLTDLLAEKIYLNFKPVQPGLFPKPQKYEGALCRMCEAPNPEFVVVGSTKIFYCQAHVDQRAEDEQVERIRDSAKAEAIADELREEGKEWPKDGDPLFEGVDINTRAAKRQRKGRVN
jgi:hypothetical protein